MKEPTVNPLSVQVDTAGPVPPYEQVRAQLADLIRAGHLAENDRLPPVRQLAADLGLATGTVARAYRELESAGLVHSRRGAGTRVAPGHAPVPEPALTQAARTYVTRARALGADDTELLAALRIALAAPPPRQ
ncbi:GntR family transcriptional regulator [Streptomyces sp. VRA16 Mangrove soil]|uniref:GntR family transcriptional regulator n=1 Tax=Streptomyces sp. VRA16 Mangrove soil TaxID=2817434 RepID=UPI001A9D3636|nr:GntR family transcriptional regulator [Streptomyces sp. VRA16 Mangrove soil]MBO1336195.1 GntR family transcriptional regulator [Streptomyces sp. VRA16 Mangrove soil]